MVQKDGNILVRTAASNLYLLTAIPGHATNRTAAMSIMTNDGLSISTSTSGNKCQVKFQSHKVITPTSFESFHIKYIGSYGDMKSKLGWRDNAGNENILTTLSRGKFPKTYETTVMYNSGSSLSINDLNNLQAHIEATNT
jgi:hypothetical protein